jgi:hypothetical protein
MNKQPFYHSMTVLFTCTVDASAHANSPEFLEKLKCFLKSSLGHVVAESVELDGEVTADPGDPSDLV